MGRLFSEDSLLVRGLNKIADLLILGIIALLCCAPVVTAGASLTALHYVALRMARGEEGYIVRQFFRAFRENFLQATLLWLIELAVFALLFVDLRIAGSGAVPVPVTFLLIAAGLLAFFIYLYVYPLQARFANPVRTTLRNALLLMLGAFPRTLAMAVVTLFPALLAWYVPVVFPLVLMFGLSVPAYTCAAIYSPLFRRFEPEEEEGKDGEGWPD